MTATRNFAYDVFVSYAHVDDERDALGVRWVTGFVEDLTSALKGFGYFDELRLCRDTRNLEAGHKLEELRRQVQNAALFLGILSPNYVKRDWTMREFRAFQESAGNSNRTILVQKMPLQRGVVLPPDMEALYRPPFYYENRETGVVMSMSSVMEPQRLRYAERVQHLAAHLIERHREAVSGTDAPHVLPEGTRSAVLLARVTDDLHDERETLRSQLRQAGIAVIPADDYPDGGAAFKARFAADLRILTTVPHPLLVQLVGPYHSKRPDELPSGYERLQTEEAARAGVPVLLWRSDSLDLSRVSDPLQAELLAGAAAMSPERLRQEILHRVAPPERPAPPPAKAGRRLVFVNSDRADLPLANEIRAALEKHDFGVVLPDFDEGEFDEPDMYMRLCEALVVVFGEVNPKWVKRQLLRYVKLRHERDNEALLELFEGPPVPKPDPGISLPDLRRVVEIDELIAHLNA